MANAQALLQKLLQATITIDFGGSLLSTALYKARALRSSFCGSKGPSSLMLELMPTPSPLSHRYQGSPDGSSCSRLVLPHVSTLVHQSLLRRAKEFDILLDDVAITHLSYGAGFSRSVEAKQVVQQEVEHSKFLWQRQKNGQAGPALIELHRIEASREIAGTLAKTPNVMYIPEGNNMMLAMNFSSRLLVKQSGSPSSLI
ncbi:hypothetical protein L7F22_065520 [Adiantum nelumboides]|nr:hypothetical protein [Adiantum nelumboides]